MYVEELYHYRLIGKHEGCHKLQTLLLYMRKLIFDEVFVESFVVNYYCIVVENFLTASIDSLIIILLAN